MIRLLFIKKVSSDIFLIKSIKQYVRTLSECNCHFDIFSIREEFVTANMRRIYQSNQVNSIFQCYIGIANQRSIWLDMFYKFIIVHIYLCTQAVKTISQTNMYIYLLYIQLSSVDSLLLSAHSTVGRSQQIRNRMTAKVFTTEWCIPFPTLSVHRSVWHQPVTRVRLYLPPWSGVCKRYTCANWPENGANLSCVASHPGDL